MGRGLKSLLLPEDQWQKYVITEDNIQKKTSFLCRAMSESETTVEICSGRGEYLIYLAQKNPKGFFLGVDRHGPVLQRAVKNVVESGMDNIRFFYGSAEEFICWMTQANLKGFLERVIISFPDPWPKKRHWKRRLGGIQFLRDTAPLIRIKGSFSLITDHRSLARWSVRSFKKLEGFYPSFFLGRYCIQSERIFRKKIPFHRVSHYSRLMKAGKKIYFLQAVKKRNCSIHQVSGLTGLGKRA